MNRNFFFNAFLVILIFSAGCTRTKKPVVQLIPRFKIPVIVQDKSDSASYFFVDSLVECRNYYFGKYKFTDTIKGLNRHTIHDSDDFDFNLKPDSFSGDGFQIFTDYKTNIFFNYYYGEKIYYPVYIVNETPRIKGFYVVNIDIDAIQEATDSYNIFSPIEVRPSGMCVGNSGVKVHPGEFLMFLMPKYSGTLKTHLRVRVLIGNNIYVSKPFEGTINLGQFFIRENMNWYLFRGVRDTAAIVQGYFLGAEPLEFTWFYKYQINSKKRKK